MIRFLTLCAVLAFVTQSAFAEPLEPVKLGPGDELTFRFQGRDSLSGPYVIGVDGQIFFPGIGAVQASGRTVPQVAAELEDRMRETFNLSSRTFSISVSEFRPIYVGGRVKQPGSYTFRPGLRVAHAIAMAGGLKGISGTDPIIALEMGREYTRLRVAEDQLAQALIRREQYLIDLGYDNDASTVVDRAGDLIGAEEAAFRADLQASLSKLSEEIDSVRFDVLEQRAATAGGETEALRGQLAALEELLDISSKELGVLEDPSERGVIPRSRILQLQRLVAATNGEISATLARRYSAENNELSLGGESKLIDASRRLENLLGLSVSDAEVSALREQITATRSFMSDFGGLPAADGENCGIEIWRSTNEELVIVPAKQSDALQPGDFVRLVEKTADGTCDN